MNKKVMLIVAIIALAIAACASNSPATVSVSNNSKSLPKQTQLILGTLKLEETANAVTAEQAAELLPMWYVLKELNSSSTAAQDEIDGLVSQIEATLTEEQTKAIADMELDAQDMMTAMQTSGGMVSSGSGSSQTRSTTGAVGSGAGGPPDMPAGGMPGGGDPMSGVAPSAGTTPSSRGSSSKVGMSKVPSALFDTVIQLLETKIN